MDNVVESDAPDEMEDDLAGIDSEEGSEERQSDDDSDDSMETSGKPCTKQAYRKDLHRALTSVKRPGRFCTTGTRYEFGLPGLEVLKLGPVRLPLGKDQAEDLTRLCTQAPFGRKEAKLSNPSIRRCLELAPTHFRLQGSGWAAQVQSLANGDVKRGLGVPEKVKVVTQLDKLLLCEPGSFLAPGQDSKPKNGIFGTLAIVLPSVHQGGELVVRYADCEAVHDFGARSVYEVHYSAFYTDCDHEILPVKSGYQLILLYNLKAKGSGDRKLASVDNRKEVTAALAAIRAWSDDDQGGPVKLVIPLEHNYSSASLSFNALRGVDLATADVLLQAAKVPEWTPFHFYLGKMVKQSEPDSDDEASEEEDENHTLKFASMVAPAGESMCYYKIKCDADELEEYGWEEGRTAQRRKAVYRWNGRSALVVWPHKQHWDIACDNGIEAAIEEAARIGSSVVAARGALEESLASCGQLSPGEAALAVDLVMEHGHVAALEELQLALRTICKHGSKTTSAGGEALAQLLIHFGSVDMVKTFLLNFSSPGDGAAICSLASHFGWATLDDDVMALLERLRATDHLADCFKLLLGMLPEGSEPPLEAAGAAGNVSVGSGDVIEKRLMSEEGGASKRKRQKREGEGVKKIRNGKRTVGAGTKTAESHGVGAHRTSDCKNGDVSSGVAQTESKKVAGPGKLTSEEKEREGLCRRGIVAIVDKILHPGTRTAIANWLHRADRNQNMPFLRRLIERFGYESVAPATKLLIRAEVKVPKTDAAGLLWESIERWGYAQRDRSSPPDLAPAALALCRQFVDELTAEFLNTEDMEISPWFPPNVNIAALLKALCSLDVERALLQSVLVKIAACPVSFPSTTIIVPALLDLVAFFGNGPPRASYLAELLWELVNALENRWPGGPPEAKNWALAAQCGCSCLHCKELVEFCQNARQTEKHISASSTTKNHLRDSIEKYNMPLTPDPKVDKVGTYLVCLKEGVSGRGDGHAMQRKEEAAMYSYEDNKKGIRQLLLLGSQLEIDPAETKFDFHGKWSAFC